MSLQIGWAQMQVSRNSLWPSTAQHVTSLVGRCPQGVPSEGDMKQPGPAVVDSDNVHSDPESGELPEDEPPSVPLAVSAARRLQKHKLDELTADNAVDDERPSKKQKKKGHPDFYSEKVPRRKLLSLVYSSSVRNPLPCICFQDARSLDCQVIPELAVHQLTEPLAAAGKRQVLLQAGQLQNSATGRAAAHLLAPC